MSKDITDELISREETSGYSFEKSKSDIEEDINKLIEELTNVRPDELSKEGLKLFNKINEIIDKNKELEEKWYKDTHKLQNDLDLANADKINNYIPVSLVEEKIEELNEYYKKEIYPSLINWSDVDVTEYYDGMISVLQELLEKR